MTVDVEDWYQVENLKPWIPAASWPSLESRVEKNVHDILDLLDIESARIPDRKPVRATFFVLGWLAERLPELIREIHSRGHEVASHGYGHELCNNLDAEAIGEDLKKSRQILEDAIGERVWGYRAPSFSIDNGTMNAIAACGYRYDSSYNSFKLHGRYGSVDLSLYAKTGIAVKAADNFYELPVSNMTIGRHTILPWGGGAYLRLMPIGLFKLGIKHILRRQGAYLFYLHPWEIDPGQPRIGEASFSARLKHYKNLDQTSRKLRTLIRTFQNCRFVACRDYLEREVFCGG
jgi:polysaccharide deacetylase family protein (PEP-CTERM system associated)